MTVSDCVRLKKKNHFEEKKYVMSKKGTLYCISHFSLEIFIRIQWQSEREEQEEMRAAGIPAPEMRGLLALQTDTELPAEV